MRQSKESIVRLHGEEYYKEWVRVGNENRRRKKAGLPPIKMDKAKFDRPIPPPPVNDISVKMYLEFADDVPLPREERLDEIEKFSGEVQKRLRKWWKGITGRTDFIIVCDAISQVKNGTTIKMTADLTQLDMDENTQHNFKVGAPSVVLECMERYEEENFQR